MYAYFRSFALALALLSSASGAEYVTQSVDVQLAAAQTGKWKTVDATAIGAPAGADLLWDITRPATKLFAVSDDESQIVFWIGKEPVEVRCDWVNFQTRKRGRIKITFTPDAPDPTPPTPPTPPDPKPPEPPTPPVPKPDGTAGLIYDKAIAVNKPEDCLRLSDNYWSVTKAIENAREFQRGNRAAPEPRIYTVAQALSAVTKANTEDKFGADWNEFGSWLFDLSTKHQTDINSLYQFYYDAAKGLKAAGEKK